MEQTFEIILAGFGGQGILFAGKVLAYAGMLEGKEVSWLPSYGPEMRGGTANCHVIVSDSPVGSPIINDPMMVIAMNKPSLDKYEDVVVSGGSIFIDSSLVGRHVRRTDIKSIEIPATQLAMEMNAPKLANMVLIGKMLKETGLVSLETIRATFAKIVPDSKKELVELNIKAVELGYNFN